MKIRYGHVSNSSSSSFIIGVDKPLDTVEDIKEQIFPELGDAEGNILHEFYDKPVHIDVLCKWFMDEVNKSTLTDYDSLFHPKPDSECQDEWDESVLSEIGFQVLYRNGEDDLWKKTRHLDWNSEEAVKLRKERDLRVLQLGKDYLDSRKEEFKGKHLYLVTFADEDGHVGCHLEHGNHWNKILHIRISHH
jgi:hypothetical protein